MCWGGGARLLRLVFVCWVMYIRIECCVCVWTLYSYLMLRPPRAPSLSHSHSRARTHARGACPVCLCVLLLPPQGKATALHKAAEMGHKDVAELLLERNADVNSNTEGWVSADGCAGGIGRGGGVGEGCCIVAFGCWSMCVCVYLVCVCWGGGARLLRFV